MFKEMFAWLEGKIYSNGRALYATDGYVIHASMHNSGQSGIAQVDEKQLVIEDKPIFDLNKAKLGKELGEVVLDCEQFKKAAAGVAGRFVRVVLRDGQIQFQTMDQYALISGLQGDIDDDFFDLFPTTETAVSANGSIPAHSGA